MPGNQTTIGSPSKAGLAQQIQDIQRKIDRTTGSENRDGRLASKRSHHQDQPRGSYVPGGCSASGRSQSPEYRPTSRSDRSSSPEYRPKSRSDRSSRPEYRRGIRSDKSSRPEYRQKSRSDRSSRPEYRPRSRSDRSSSSEYRPTSRSDRSNRHDRSTQNRRNYRSDTSRVSYHSNRGRKRSLSYDSSDDTRSARSGSLGRSYSNLQTLKNRMQLVQGEERSIRDTKPVNQAIMNFVGVEVSKNDICGPPLHDEFANTWLGIIQQALPSETREAIMKEYPRPSNCPYFAAPTLNTEVKTILIAAANKRDECYKSTQNEAATVLTIIGRILSLFTDAEPDEEDGTIKVNFEVILQYLGKAAKLSADILHAMSQSRKALISGSNDMKRSAREIIEKSISDEFLLGKNFGEALKSLYASQKAGEEMLQKDESIGQYKPQYNRKSRTSGCKFSKTTNTGYNQDKEYD